MYTLFFSFAKETSPPPTHPLSLKKALNLAPPLSAWSSLILQENDVEMFLRLVHQSLSLCN